MNYPGDYDVVNPLWQRGLAYGVEQERERIIALIREIETRHTNFYQLATSGEIMRAIRGEGE